MAARRNCRSQAELIALEAPVRTAAQRMAAHDVGMLLVVDDCQHVLGIVTDRDLALRVLGAGRDPNLTCVGDVMTPHPEPIDENASVEDALAVMRSRRMLAYCQPWSDSP